uniref:Uncharacterized protein n=1 Tax=Arundo donax TaxID=35708 RepID=A0A0A9A913_ARUDO
MESRTALASVVVVVSNTCPPTLNRTRPPPAIGARQRTDILHHPGSQSRVDSAPRTGEFRGGLGRRIGLALTRVHGRG